MIYHNRIVITMSSANYWGEIQSNYESYLDRYPDEGMISTGHPEFNFPLQSGVLNHAGITMR